MAFNFLSGYPQYGKTAYDPADDSIYNDPRRMGSVGSFNPYALSNFASMQKGGMTPPGTPSNPPSTPPPGNTPPSNTPPPNNPQAGNYTFKPGYGWYFHGQGNTETKPSMGGTPGAPSTPSTPGGGTPGAGTGGINYGQYRSIADAYAAFPGGLPPGWNWDAWAAATGNQDALRRTTSGDYNTFTWNPGGGGYINPMTGETFDRLGETIRR